MAIEAGANLEALPVKGAVANNPDKEPNLGNTVPEEVSTNQEAAVIPWGCGEFKAAVRWLCQPANQTTKESTTQAGKK